MKFWLAQATTSAAEVDYLILALLLTSCAILALVFGLILLYMIKYRAGSDIDRGVLAEKTWRLETAWTVATLLIFFGLFVWGADLYVRLFQPPSNALKIYVSASSGCGKSSIKAASARSTPCICRSGGRSSW